MSRCRADTAEDFTGGIRRFLYSAHSLQPIASAFHCDSDSGMRIHDESQANGAARVSKRIFEDFSAALDTNCLTFTYPLADARGSVCPAILYCLNRRIKKCASNCRLGSSGSRMSGGRNVRTSGYHKRKARLRFSPRTRPSCHGPRVPQ
jgi:hypothetical protein